MPLSSSEIMAEITLYKSKISPVSSEMENFLKYLDDIVFKRSFFFCSPGRGTMAPSFTRAFGTLTDIEKADYYLACLKIVFDLTKSKGVLEDEEKSPEKMDVLIRQQNKQWRKVSVLMSFKNAIIQIESLKIKVKLEDYIFRMSKTKSKFAFALESTKADCEPMTMRLGMTKIADFEGLLLKMKGMVMTALKKKISRMMGLGRESMEYKSNWFDVRPKLPTQRASKSVKQIVEEFKSGNSLPEIQKSMSFQKAPQQGLMELSERFILQNKLIQRLDNFEDFDLVEKGLFVHSGQKRIRKVCSIDESGITLKLLMSELINHLHFRLWKSCLRFISLIGEIPQENTRVYYQIDGYKDGHEVDFIYFRYGFQRDGVAYFLDKSTNKFGLHQTSDHMGRIEYCFWRIRENSSKLIEVLVEAEILDLPCEKVVQAMSQQVGELENMVLCLNEAEVEKSEKLLKPSISFFSLEDKDSFNSGEDNLQYDELLMQNDESGFFSMIGDAQQKMGNKSERVSFTPFLQGQESVEEPKRYQITPRNVKQKNYREFKGGNFFDEDECIANQKGDLVFTNKQKIKAQGGVILNVLKTMGTNLISGKNILNVSLPIGIFAADTNLERLCKCLAYAPHFLENKSKAAPLERMKAAICFAIGNLLLYIEMSKPFNPILGQTYQAFIDGCPVYGEQTSHHPPISSIFFIGRDYFISGNIEATVELGLNSVSGTNSGEYKIAFHGSDPNKNVVRFTCPPGELSGVIYGQRKLNITNTSRFYDMENQIFCELSWGKKKTSSPVSRYHDYFEGKIVELSKPATNIDKVKTSDKDTNLGYITGRWTEMVYFNEQPIFEINKLRPFAVADEPVPLQSDSRFRQDRLYVQGGKLKEGQAAKERLQQFQRRDRKLRKDYCK